MRVLAQVSQIEARACAVQWTGQGVAGSATGLCADRNRPPAPVGFSRTPQRPRPRPDWWSTPPDVYYHPRARL